MTNAAYTFIRQTGNIARARLKSRFRGSFLGVAWVVTHPIYLLALKFLVFGTLLGEQNVSYFCRMASGFLPWFFFAQSICMTSGAFLRYGGLMRSNTRYAFVMLVSDILTNFFILLLGMLIIIGKIPALGLIYLPAALVMLFMCTVSASLLVAVAQIFVRDTQFLIPLLLQTMLFLSPILYPDGVAPVSLTSSYLINPFYTVLRIFPLLWTRGAPPLLMMIQGMGFSMMMAVIAFMVWHRFRERLLAYV